MATKKEKLYARISEYGDLLVPIQQLELVLAEGYIVRTTYENGEDHITDVRDIRKSRFHVHTESELNTAIATQKLSE